MGVAKMNIAEKAEKEKANEEFKGDDQAADAQPKDDQVRNLDSVTYKDKSELLQSTSNHSLSSNFSNQFLNNSPNASLISTIPENAEVEINSLRHASKGTLEKHTKELHQQVPQDDVSTFIKVKQELAAKEKMLKYSTTPYDQAADDEHKQKDILFLMMMASKKIQRDDKDQDPPVGSDQWKKKRRTRKDVEPSMISSKSKKSTKGKTPSNTSKSGKFVTTNKSIHKYEHVMPMDVKDPNLDNVANDVDDPQADAILKIPKKN
ncbi:hypothetical protein Tco_1406859 [Tanacetum coccineum]